MALIRFPYFLRQPAVTRLDRDRAALRTEAGEITVTAPWFGDLAPLINGHRSTADLIATAPAFNVSMQMMDTLLRLHGEGVIVDAALDPLDPARPIDPQSPETGDLLLLRQTNLATGLVPRVYRRDSVADFLHVVVAPAVTPPASEKRLGDDTRVSVGTGVTETDAIISCVGETIERYSLSFHGTEKRIFARARALDAPAVPPSHLLLISDAQYASRAESNRQWWGDVWLPARPDDDAEHWWTPVRSALSGELRYVPAAWCFMRMPSAQPETFGGDSNGCAAGRTPADAAVRGLLELAERDALSIWWYNRLTLPEVSLADFGGDLGRHLTNQLHARGRSLDLIDLTNDLGIPVVTAVSARADGRGVAYGFGAGLLMENAVRRALLEMQQVLGAVDGTGAGPLLERWAREADIRQEPWLRPTSQPSTTPDALQPGQTPLEACCAAVRRLGLDLLFANCTRPEIGVPAVRAIVPGLRLAPPRFAPGRLYDVPVKLGWLPQPRTEDELNPFPFFL